ncbi:MAG: hypothetical protein IV092_18045 [Burkholderiaceae bacterium]|nr:hypothetical protein [Burkholderiaceae bacterium]
MSNPTAAASRTGLNSNQIKALQKVLDDKKRGKVIDVVMGTPYAPDIEPIAAVGEDLTERFTDHFIKTSSWRVRFLMLDSELSNAYAYWMSSFEAICLTTTMAREIAELSDDVARYLLKRSGHGSGFAYLTDVDLPLHVKHAALRSLLIQGAMTFFVGHEAGHLAAGHKAVIVTGASNADPDEEHVLFVDEFVAAAKAEGATSNNRSLRLNAHEVDADVQGFALAAAFWLNLKGELEAADDLPAEAALICASCTQPDRLLLLASTGAAIAMSIMGFKEFDGDWNKQPTHPLTAVRSLIGLVVLSKRLTQDQAEQTTLRLLPQCVEALSLVHSRLGSLLLMAARADGNYSPVARMLEDAPKEQKLDLMFHATGVAQAVSQSHDVVSYLAALSSEFDACASLRASGVRVAPTSLAQWSALVL